MFILKIRNENKKVGFLNKHCTSLIHNTEIKFMLKINNFYIIFILT